MPDPLSLLLNLLFLVGILYVLYHVLYAFPRDLVKNKDEFWNDHFNLKPIENCLKKTKQSFKKKMTGKES